MNATKQRPKRITCASCRRRAELVLAVDQGRERAAREELTRLRRGLLGLLEKVSRQDVGPYGIEIALRAMLEE